ncbi:hypothetical protein Acr_01g0015090 [Actinidia rufa]|uniref:Retrotransposon gag domain-containing protein n=1 Tax=Actinidia rufa TaxID=165716 RepID=A0A7J0E5C2_9ERIC|nr:hypothetical protein Acr_01g0015090 [Actinidia rufa]
MAEQMRIMNENNACLVQLLTAANPPPPAAPPILDMERSHHSNHSGCRSQNLSTDRARRRRHRSPSSPRRERSSSSESSEVPAIGGEYMGRGRSPRRGSARSWFRKLPPVTIDSFSDLNRLFVANFMSYRNRQKNASHLFTIHQKETESLKDFVKQFNQTVLEVKDPSDKVIIIAMMEGLRLGPLFDSLSENIPETLCALQSKVDKYIAAEELTEAKRGRREKEDHKRKELDTRRIDYREEARNKRHDRESKCPNDKRPRSPPYRLEFVLPPLNAPLPKYSQKLNMKSLSNGPGRSRLTPRRGTGTNIVNSTETTGTAWRIVFN